ncbi:hypothetical protein V8D89_010920 [Ganoderma adspersum]
MYPTSGDFGHPRESLTHDQRDSARIPLSPRTHFRGTAAAARGSTRCRCRWPSNLPELGCLNAIHLLKLLSLHGRKRKAVAVGLDDKDLYSANERWNRCTGNGNGQGCDVVVDHPR